MRLRLWLCSRPFRPWSGPGGKRRQELKAQQAPQRHQVLLRMPPPQPPLLPPLQPPLQLQQPVHWVEGQLFREPAAVQTIRDRADMLLQTPP